MSNETIEEKVARLNMELVVLIPHDQDYPLRFEKEKNNLFSILPNSIIKRVEHFGSTAIANLTAKPIIDLLVEVSSLDETKEKVVPILESQGYDYLWRPVLAMDGPWYAWFIKRDHTGKRTHHIHMIEKNYEMWNRLLFRDYLRDFSEVAKEYEQLKIKLSRAHTNDRAAYTLGKSEFILEGGSDEKSKETLFKIILILIPV